MKLKLKWENIGSGTRSTWEAKATDYGPGEPVVSVYKRHDGLYNWSVGNDFVTDAGIDEVYGTSKTLKDAKVAAESALRFLDTEPSEWGINHG